MPIINPPSAPSKNPTKYPYRVPKELPSSKPSNIMIYSPSVYPTDALSTILTEHPIAYPYSFRIQFGYTSDVYKSQSNKIHFRYIQRKWCKIRFGHLINLILTNFHNTNLFFWSKMYPFE